MRRRDNFENNNQQREPKRERYRRGRRHWHHSEKEKREEVPSPTRVFAAALTVGIPALFGMIEEAITGKRHRRW